jgi:hypothetical protein
MALASRSAPFAAPWASDTPIPFRFAPASTASSHARTQARHASPSSSRLPHTRMRRGLAKASRWSLFSQRTAPTNRTPRQNRQRSCCSTGGEAIRRVATRFCDLAESFGDCWRLGFCPEREDATRNRAGAIMPSKNAFFNAVSCRMRCDKMSHPAPVDLGSPTGVSSARPSRDSRRGVDASAALLPPCGEVYP